MRTCRILYHQLQECLDPGWRHKAWPARVYRFRWSILGLTASMRLVGYLVLFHFSPSSCIDDPLHLLVTSINLNELTLWAITGQVIFCTIVLFFASATFDKPWQSYIYADIFIYRLEKAYLDNFEAHLREGSRWLKRWMRSYHDHEWMSFTSDNYNPDHFVRLSPAIYKTLLIKINRIEFVLFFSTAVWGNDQDCLLLLICFHFSQDCSTPFRASWLWLASFRRSNNTVGGPSSPTSTSARWHTWDTTWPPSTQSSVIWWCLH